MLYCGGVPIDLDKAKWPYMEDPRQTREGGTEWIGEYEGSALKWLEPSTFVPPTGYPWKTIWLDRNRKQQSKSHVKFNLRRGHEHVRRQMTSESYKRFMAGKRQRRATALNIWRRRGPLLMLQYESIKKDPRAHAARIASFVGLDLDVVAMASAVRNRETKCLEYMLEEQLKREGPP
jgi:hypothetical protein